MDLANLSETMHVLTGAAPGPRGVRTWIDLHDRVRRGLPTSMYRHVRQVLERFPFPEEMVDRLARFVVAPATLKRRTSRLSPEESERLARVARLLAMAATVFDDPQDVVRFLTRPHPLLHGKTPVDLIQTDVGLRQVEEVLARVLHGLPV
jgi:putative toxin-antitoxin system antitoxin component (TIGR02293 family)